MQGEVVARSISLDLDPRRFAIESNAPGSDRNVTEGNIVQPIAAE
jgi:hypothetical protein